MIKNIIFDWSGTLSDDLTPVYQANMQVFKKYGAKKISLEEFRREFKLPYMNFHRKYLPKISKRKVDSVFAKAIYQVKKPKPFPKVKKILELLNQKGIKLTLLSSHPQEKLEKEIKDYGFQKFFIDVDGSVHDKTKTILGIMKRNGFKKKETAYVGDMTHDIKTGSKIGVLTIAVSWGYQSKGRLSKENPDFLIDDPGEMKNIFS